MAKRVKIPGRLESAETGNIVTGADAVMDDARGKTQYVVNNELEGAILQLGESKQNKLTFDSAPTEGSQNPVTSAGVYTADKVLSDAIDAILLLIPSAASALNKLVDMQTMNSSIATATASFKGTYNLVSDLHLGVDAIHEQIGAALDALSLGADNNDYAFVQVPNSATAPKEIRVTERYKFNGTNWLFEYDLNNSGFTQGQWNAINSGVTSLLVGKLSDMPTNAELTTMLAGKQDNLTFDNVPTAGSPNPVKSGGVYARNNEIVALINALDEAKQDVLTFDNAPVEGSHNPVKSGGVYTAISAVQAAVVALDAAKQNVLTFDSTPTLGSANPVTSSGIKTELNRIDGNITTLNDLYEALTQSALVIVQPTDTWPVASPATSTIYRVVDRTNTPSQYYSDYMWNGSAMVLMATYDNAIDPRPKKASQNLVTSGGVFDNMGALDVSELNAMGNPHTLAQYVDLSAALAAVPTDYQKGGMSIKFVHISDNKYVQYRLMADAWSTVVTDWQGVDDEPTAGSDNLVKSSGVYNYVGEYAILNQPPILNTSERTFTMPAGSFIAYRNGQISSTPNDIVWSRNDAKPYGYAYLVLNVSDFSHRVINALSIPKCSDDECIIALVAWTSGLIKCNVPHYYINGRKDINISKYSHSYLSRPVFWRDGHIEITKDRTDTAKISVRVLENCLFFLEQTYITINASESYVDINNTNVVLLGITKNTDGTFELALKDYSDFHSSDFYVITSIFHDAQLYGAIISSVDSTPNAFITLANTGIRKAAGEWAKRYNVNTLDGADDFTKQLIYNKEKLADLIFDFSSNMLLIRLTSFAINLIPGGKYMVVQSGHTDYQYQVIDSSSVSIIDGGYSSKTREFIVPDDGIVIVMLKKSDDSAFTPDDVADINGEKVFTLYHDKSIIRDDNQLAQNNAVNLWGTEELEDGYFYQSTSGNKMPNEQMTCSLVSVKPGTRLYVFGAYCMMAYYDVNMNYISGYYYNNEYKIPSEAVRATDVPWNAVYAGIGTRLSRKYELVVTECPFPSAGLESYRNVSKQLLPKSQIVHQDLNCIYDRSRFVSTGANNSLSFIGTVSVNNDGHLDISSDSGVCVVGLHTTVDRSTIGVNSKITAASTNGRLLRLGYYGSLVVGTGITDADTWIDMYADKIELYNGNLRGTTAFKKAEAILSEAIAAGDEIELRIEKDSIYHHIVKVLKRYVTIGEIDLTASVDPNDSDHALNQMRSWGAPAIWTGTDATATISRLFFYSNCPQYAKLAIVGDSYVENMSRSKASGWVRLLEEKIGKDNIFISGQGGGKADALITKLPLELNLCRPKYVILQTGTNDTSGTTDAYKEKILQLIDMVKSVNAIPVLMTTPRLGDRDNLAWMNEVNPWIKSLGYKYVDIAYCLSTGDSLTRDADRMRSDMVHPNHVGAEAIFNWVESNLPEIL